jgi:hypothetical protein
MNGNEDDNIRRQLEALRKGIKLHPNEFAIEALVPVLVPGEFVEPGWPGPITRLKAAGVALTWAVLMPEETMIYVNHEAVDHWVQQEVDWHKVALKNLFRMSPELSSHSFVRSDGEYFGLAMQQTDGIGPSRLLLTEWLKEIFPHGYLCAIPERSMGVVVSATATAEEYKRAADLVDRCYREGTSPFRTGFFSPSELVALDQ